MPTTTPTVASMDRRTFFLASAALVSGAAGQPKELESFTQWLAESRVSREATLKTWPNRVSRLDRDVQAWVQVSPQKATGDGPLTGIPFGVKDIIETKGLATEYGSPIYKGRIGTADAAIVQLMRQQGGVLLGKTHTTSFAYLTPAPTHNPRNLSHTPGGSSSGSAAAVAAGMVPVALGTQTGGSVVRPASFCGVVGFKVSHGLISTEGVLPFAKSLDTLGFFTHTAADMLAFWSALGQVVGRAEDVSFAVPEPLPDVEPVMAIAFRAAIEHIRRAGLKVGVIDIAPMLGQLRQAQRVVMFYEGARFHEERYRQYGDRLADMANLVREGLQMPVDRYDEARRFIAECKIKMAEMFNGTPVILTPAAAGPAPEGLASTGDSRLNAPWTALGTPAITIPMSVGSALPLGLQMTAGHGQDARLLQAAIRVERLLGQARTV